VRHYSAVRFCHSRGFDGELISDKKITQRIEQVAEELVRSPRRCGPNASAWLASFSRDRQLLLIGSKSAAPIQLSLTNKRAR